MGRQRKELNRDQRLRIQTLRESGKTYQQIVTERHAAGSDTGKWAQAGGFRSNPYIVE